MKKTWIKVAIIIATVLVVASLAIGCKKQEQKEEGYTGHVKIGILVKLPTTDQNKRFLTVLNEYAADQALDVEFVMSGAINSAEDERKQIETWANSGINGVISCVDSLTEELKGELFEEKEMYFITYNAPSDAKLAKYCNDGNEYYLGGFGAANTDEQSAYNAVSYMLKDKKGAITVAIGTAFKNNGTEMFVNRFNGAMRAINEWTAIAGNSLKEPVIEVPGFSTALTEALPAVIEKQPDVIFAVAGGEYWSTQIQSAMEKDPSYDPVVGVVDSISHYTWIESGWCDTLLCTNDDRIALSFAYLYNIIRGSKQVTPNSQEHQGKMVENLTMDLFTKDNIQDAKKVLAATLYTTAQVKNVIVKTNAKATYADFTNLLYGKN